VATTTSLNLRAILKTAVARSGMDSSAPAVSGLTPSAKALFVAAAAQARPHGVVLYVVPGDAELEQATADVRFFLAALEGLAPAAIERSVLPFPSHEVDPYRGMAPHVGVTSARAQALHAVGRGIARVIVASASALLPRVSAPRRLLGASIDLKPGQDIAPPDLAELLVDAGFSREDPADEHGEFAQRGGIVDIFPAGAPHPVRLEFIGDTIETLRTYDPGTQRSIAPIDQVSIVPLRDVLATANGKEEDRSSTLFEHLSRAKDPRVILSEPDEVDANARKLIERVRESYDEAIAREKRALPPPADLFAAWENIEAHLNAGTSLHQLGLDAAGTEIRCQPAVEMRGRVGDWVAEIKRLREAGETAVFVAATTGRAERTIEMLKEYEVLAVPVERAEDARYAAVLVAVGDLSRGFRLAEAGLQIFAETDVFEEDRHAP